MYPESLLSRFRAVDALAQLGEPGERDNARRILAKMEAENPGIRLEAYIAPKSEWKPEPEPQPKPWERWRDVASGAFDWASKVASEVLDAERARNLADEMCEIQIKSLASGKWQMALRLDERDLKHAARTLSPVQKIEFVRHILAAMETELLDVLT